MSKFRDEDVLRWGYMGIAILYLAWVCHWGRVRSLGDTRDTRTFREWLPSAARYHHELGVCIILVLGWLVVVLTVVLGRG